MSGVCAASGPTNEYEIPSASYQRRLATPFAITTDASDNDACEQERFRECAGQLSRRHLPRLCPE